MLEVNEIFPIGMGTWGIGGLAQRNPNNDDRKQVDAMSYTLKKGVNYIEVNLWYAEGHTAKLVSEAVVQSKIKREKLFISQVSYGYTAKSISHAEKEFETMMKIFGTNYIDAVAFSASDMKTYGYKGIADLANKMITSGKARFLTVTNASLETLKMFHKDFGSKLFGHEIGFNFEIRENEDMGMIPYADKNNIKNIIYQPLRRNRTVKYNYPLLVELADKYKKTQNQVILNWIHSRGFLPLTKSENTQHIDENIEAVGFNMSENDYKRMNAFRVPGYKSPKIFFGREGGGTPMFMLSNVFDDIMAKNK